MQKKRSLVSSADETTDQGMGVHKRLLDLLIGVQQTAKGCWLPEQEQMGQSQSTDLSLLLGHKQAQAAILVLLLPCHYGEFKQFITI